MQLDPRLMEILACPQCHSPLRAEEGGEHGDELVCTSEVVLSVARVKASDYPAFRAFLGRMDQAFARKVVLEGPPAGSGATTSGSGSQSR